MNIYVQNLNYSLKEEELRDLFTPFGEVSSVKIIKDKVTGRARGFGFVEMPNDSEAENAIRDLNGVDVKGRNIQVNEARPPQQRDSR